MTQPLNWIIRTDEPFRGISQSFTYKADDGIERVAYTGLTLDEYRQERDYPFELITGEELDKRMKEFEQSLITEPTEIEEGDYWYALEVLPPMRWDGSLFHVSEALQGTLVNWYFKRGGKYYHFINHAHLPQEELKKIVESV